MGPPSRLAGTKHVPILRRVACLSALSCGLQTRQTAPVHPILWTAKTLGSAWGDDLARVVLLVLDLARQLRYPVYTVRGGGPSGGKIAIVRSQHLSHLFDLLQSEGSVFMLSMAPVLLSEPQADYGKRCASS